MPTPIGELFKTNMPDLTGIADIQEALRIYHYGVPVGPNVPGESYNPNNTDPQNLEEFSVAGHLQTLTERINNFSAGLTSDAWTDKGVLITANAPGSPVKIDPGAAGQVLTVNPSTFTGLEWRTLDITADNTITLLNKTLSLASVAQPGLKFLGNVGLGNEFFTYLTAVEPTANRTIFLPNIDTTLIGAETPDTLTNKTISLSNNTISGTVSQFNSALSDASFLTTLNAVTIAQGGTGATTVANAKINLDIFRNTSSAAFSGKVYVADPATVGATGAGITGAAAGDLWFW